MDNVYVVGSINMKKLLPAELNIVSQYLGHNPTSYLIFNRIKMRYEVYHSRRYKRCYARNSYTIAYQTLNGNVNFGQVEYYLQLYPFCDVHGQVSPTCGCEAKNVVLVSKLERLEEHRLANDETTNTDVRHIVSLRCRQNNEFVIVPIKNILHKCVFVEIIDQPIVVYACMMPNQYEHDWIFYENIACVWITHFYFDKTVLNIVVIQRISNGDHIIENRIQIEWF